jgi:hypothetical protein
MNEPTGATTTWTPECGIPFEQVLIDDRPASSAPAPRPS